MPANVPNEPGLYWAILAIPPLFNQFRGPQNQDNLAPLAEPETPTEYNGIVELFGEVPFLSLHASVLGQFRGTRIPGRPWNPSDIIAFGPKIERPAVA